MSEFTVDKIANRDGSVGTQVCGVTTFSGTSGMIIPGGPTEYRGGRGIGLFSGGYLAPGGDRNSIQKIEIATTGDSIDFGDLTTERRGTGGCCASSIRSVMVGGRDSPVNETAIDHVMFSSQGGATAFGELTEGISNSGQCSSATRGICYSGARGNPSPATSAKISFITLATGGNVNEFGTATSALICSGAAQSPTRGLFAGGYNPAELKSIDYVTIASKGNGLDFGELLQTIRRTAGSSNSIRAIWAGGNRFPSAPNGVVDISYSTIATFGNAIDFGDLDDANAGAGAACASSTRSVINRTGSTSPTNVLGYVTIATLGDSTDFGYLLYGSEKLWGRGGSSDVHGGLG